MALATNVKDEVRTKSCWTHAHGAKRQVQGIRSRGQRHRPGDPEELRQLFLQGRDIGAENELAALQHLVNRRVDPVPDLRVLRLEVQDWNRHGYAPRYCSATTPGATRVSRSAAQHPSRGWVPGDLHPVAGWVPAGTEVRSPSGPTRGKREPARVPARRVGAG